VKAARKFSGESLGEKPMLFFSAWCSKPHMLMKLP